MFGCVHFRKKSTSFLNSCAVAALTPSDRIFAATVCGHNETWCEQASKQQTKVSLSVCVSVSAQVDVGFPFSAVDGNEEHTMLVVLWMALNTEAVAPLPSGSISVNSSVGFCMVNKVSQQQWKAQANNMCLFSLILTTNSVACSVFNLPVCLLKSIANSYQREAEFSHP